MSRTRMTSGGAGRSASSSPCAHKPGNSPPRRRAARVPASSATACRAPGSSGAGPSAARAATFRVQGIGSAERRGGGRSRSSAEGCGSGCEGSAACGAEEGAAISAPASGEGLRTTGQSVCPIIRRRRSRATRPKSAALATPLGSSGISISSAGMLPSPLGSVSPPPQRFGREIARRCSARFPWNGAARTSRAGGDQGRRRVRRGWARSPPCRPRPGTMWRQ